MDTAGFDLSWMLQAKQQFRAVCHTSQCRFSQCYGYGWITQEVGTSHKTSMPMKCNLHWAMQAFLSPPSYNSHQSSFHQVAAFRKVVFLTLDAPACWIYQPRPIKIGRSFQSSKSLWIKIFSLLLNFQAAFHWNFDFGQLNQKLRQVSGNKSKWNEPFNEQPPLLQNIFYNDSTSSIHVLQKCQESLIKAKLNFIDRL